MKIFIPSVFKNKKIVFDWHLVGLLPIVFGIVYYIYNILNHIEFWNFLWVCPAVAILAGFFVFSKNCFGMSAAIIWISSGPLLTVLFETKKSLQFWQLYHIFSVVILFIILYHAKEIWNVRGFLFGSASFYSYILITSYFSKGKINLVGDLWVIDERMLYSGIFFAILSVLFFLWDKFSKK